MPDRYSYQNPFSGRGEPWFVLGGVGFTTTVTIIAINIGSMILWALEGPGHPITDKLIFVSQGQLGERGFLGGEVWRLFTWPLFASPDIWTIIGLAVFFMLGGQLEALMGRRAYLSFILMLTVIPPLIATIVELVSPSFSGSVGGIGVLQFGVLVAFAAQYPTAKFFFGIPAPLLVGVFVGIQYLQILGLRDEFGFVFLTAIIAVALIGLKSLGFASQQAWIPTIPLPAFMTGASSRPADSPRRSRGERRRRRAKPTHLSSVPSEDERLAEMEIDALLDQIGENGIESLTKEQRKRLEGHSKRMRKKRKP